MADEMTIINTAKRLVKKYVTRDPYKLADALGIQVMSACAVKCQADDYEVNLKKLPGFYVAKGNMRLAILNDRLDPYFQRIVLAHEIGHDVFQRDTSREIFISESKMYNNKDRSEWEANYFAAAFLIDDKEILDLIYVYRYDASMIAKELYTDVSLVSMKIEQLKKCGYELRNTPRKDDFIKDRCVCTEFY